MSLLICSSLSISFNMWNDIHSNISWKRKFRNSHQNSVRTISCCHFFFLQIIDVSWRWSKNCAWCKIDLLRFYVICFAALIHELYLLFIFISCWKFDQIKSLRAIVRLNSSRSSSIFALLYIYISFCSFLSQSSQSHLSTRRSKHIQSLLFKDYYYNSKFKISSNIEFCFSSISFLLVLIFNFHLLIKSFVHLSIIKHTLQSSLIQSIHKLSFKSSIQIHRQDVRNHDKIFIYFSHLSHSSRRQRKANFYSSRSKDSSTYVITNELRSSRKKIERHRQRRDVSNLFLVFAQVANVDLHAKVDRKEQDKNSERKKEQKANRSRAKLRCSTETSCNLSSRSFSNNVLSSSSKRKTLRTSRENQRHSSDRAIQQRYCNFFAWTSCYFRLQQ